MIREENRMKLEEAFRKAGGILKTRDLYEQGLTYREIDRMLREDILKRVKSGYYSLVDDSRSEEEQIAVLFPDGVLCLESALYYYGYMDMKPFCWHIAIDKNTSKSRFKLDYPIVVPYYTEPEYLSLGIKKVTFGQGTMGIYEKERLICDCLKFENKLEHEIRKQALAAFLKDSEKDIEKLLEYAKLRKVMSKVQAMIGVWL